jgi:GNAT superfamily N-acetyltransferase
VRHVTDTRIERVELSQVVDLRHEVLRAGLARETAVFDGDDEPATAHFAAVRGGIVVGCVTIMRRPHEGRDAWQLRGMAVAPDLQRGGVGARLLRAAEDHVRHAPDAPRQMWCNARVPASGFYVRHGWRVVSAPFDIPTAGPHVRMAKIVE